MTVTLLHNRRCQLEPSSKAKNATIIAQMIQAAVT